MKHILVRDGARPPSSYDDFVSIATPSDGAQIGFYHRVEPGLRLVRNRTRSGPAFAIAHYQTDPALRIQHPSYFRPIDTDIILTALDRYEYVFLGVITQTHMLSDTDSIEQAQYLARTPDGKLINVETNVVIESERVTFITMLLGAIRITGFPVYCFFLNPDLLHATDGFDFYDSSNDTMWYLTTDRDGSLHNMLFSPTVDHPARLIGNTILTSAPAVVLNMASPSQSIFEREDVNKVFEAASWSVETNLEYVVKGSTFTIAPPLKGEVGYFELRFNCGLFFDLPRASKYQHEHPTFKYVVLST